MTDVVVTVPMFQWHNWIEEGTLPDEPWNGIDEFHFFGSGNPPKISPGERVYIVAHNHLRGYAPLIRIDTPELARQREPATWAYWWWQSAQWGLVRRGGAVAVTIPERIRGFQGWRYRWWAVEDEVPFPDWRTAGVNP